MDKTLADYDQSLQELERQREQLELVMEKMGQEWEESGAGIGWMGSIDLASQESSSQTTPLSAIPATPAADNASNPSMTAPLFGPLPNPTPSGPSPAYLQSLLNMNEALLAQSLSGSSLINDTGKDTNNLVPCVTLPSDPCILSPPATPDEPVIRSGMTRRLPSLEPPTTTSSN